MLRELFYINGNVQEINGSDGECLLILLGEQLLSTIIYNPKDKAVYSWRMAELPVDLLNQEDVIREYFSNQASLLYWKGRVEVVAVTGRQSIVPLSILNEQDLSLFAHLQFPSGKEDQLLSDKDEKSQTAVLYSLNRSVLNAIGKLFTAAKVTHLFHHYLKNPASENPLLTVHILPSRCMITVQHKEKWQLLQSYQYQSGEDVLYLILKAMDQLGIDPLLAQVCINGLVDRKSSLAQLLDQYLPNIEWGGNHQFQYPEAEGFDKHSYSFIDSILTCVS